MALIALPFVFSRLCDIDRLSEQAVSVNPCERAMRSRASHRRRPLEPLEGGVLVLRHAVALLVATGDDERRASITQFGGSLMPMKRTLRIEARPGLLVQRREIARRRRV